MARVVAVNVATPEYVGWASAEHTSIGKRTVSGSVEVTALGLSGDEVADVKHHGGTEQAVYAFAREDLDSWAGELGVPLPDGAFGENLTTEGIDVNAAIVGERWRIGTVVLEISTVRIPCRTFADHLGSRLGADSAGWVKRFTQAAAPGPYFRVLEPGELAAGDPIEVLHRPTHGVSVATMFAALTTERHLLPELLAVSDLNPVARERVETFLAGS
ncbi:MOSC domain-containing protein [Nocardioides limicola]|uniref:MOSC domain-containing protein n=1 Tax=Nocardioides limicola TaxID=2803368 RepID=UPI00193C70B9|nr:MOSC domain-containing protein [Nocardioides sp. DJM-14]